MKRLTIIAIIAAMVIGFALGSIVTRRSARYIGETGDGGYVISYQIGPVWQNDLYS